MFETGPHANGSGKNLEGQLLALSGLERKVVEFKRLTDPAIDDDRKIHRLSVRRRVVRGASFQNHGLGTHDERQRIRNSPR